MLERNDLVCPACGNDGDENKIMVGGQKILCNCREQRARKHNYEFMNIPREYWYLGWEDYQGDPDALIAVKKYIDNLNIAVSRNIGLFLYGEVGTGKTFLAVQVLKEALKQRYINCCFVYLSGLVEMFAAGWHDKERQRAFENQIMKADILVIDDLGKELKNSLVESVFDNVIRARETPTIITSNVSKHNIGKVYGKSIASLFNSKLIHIEPMGSDFRGGMDLADLIEKEVVYRPLK